MVRLIQKNFHTLLPLVLGLCLLSGGNNSEAASGKIYKVLPHFLDTQGRHSLSPSLYERDAYQYFLRNTPAQRSGVAYDVRWKTRGSKEPRLRLELRGVKEKKVRQIEREITVKKKGWFSSWSRVGLTGSAYEALDEINAWRVTLWDGETMLDEDKSFLW